MSSLLFDPTSYGESVARLLVDVPPCELGPGQPSQDRLADLKGLTVADITTAAAHAEMARCCIAGLWLRHDYLHQSHELSQNISGPSGSYWHGIMHRREPDYGNAKYWFRRVGDHAIFPQLLVAAQDVATRVPPSEDGHALLQQAAWDPFTFVDLCAAVAGRSDEEQRFARQVATAEWQLLFDYCYRAATNAHP